MAGPVAETAPPGYRLRPRRQDEDPLLVGVENRAAGLFRDHGFPEVADNPFATVADFRAMIGSCRVWVAADERDRPVGYAVAGPLGGGLHLRELSVDPAHARRGIGSALVRAVIDAARTDGASRVSLTTFRNVPFNRPFYETLGFNELDLRRAPDALTQAFHDELPAGVAASARLLMEYPLADFA